MDRLLLHNGITIYLLPYPLTRISFAVIYHREIFLEVRKLSDIDRAGQRAAFHAKILVLGEETAPLGLRLFLTSEVRARAYILYRGARSAI